MLKPDLSAPPVAQPEAPQARPRLYESGWWRLGFNAAASLLAMLAVPIVGGIGVALSPSGTFLSSANMTNMTGLWLIRAIMVPPIVLILAAGGLDLSVGAVVGLTSVLVAKLAPEMGLGTAVALSLGVALLAGLVNGLLAGGTRIHGAIVTLAMAALLRGVALQVTGGKAITATGLRSWSTSAVPWGLLAVSVAASLVFAGLVMARKPRRRPGDDQQPWLARLFFTGVPYVLSSVMAGLAGLVYLSRIGVGLATAGSGMETEQILIALMGGVPLIGLPMAMEAVNILGALAAAVVVTEAQNLLLLAGGQNTIWEVLKGAGILGVGLLSYLCYWVVSLLRGEQRR